jgi:hypothetical protein
VSPRLAAAITGAECALRPPPGVRQYFQKAARGPQHVAGDSSRSLHGANRRAQPLAPAIRRRRGANELPSAQASGTSGARPTSARTLPRGRREVTTSLGTNLVWRKTAVVGKSLIEEFREAVRKSRPGKRGNAIDERAQFQQRAIETARSHCVYSWILQSNVLSSPAVAAPRSRFPPSHEEANPRQSASAPDCSSVRVVRGKRASVMSSARRGAVFGKRQWTTRSGYLQTLPTPVSRVLSHPQES